MPRIGRIALPGIPHHVTQRGNNKQDIFFTDEDRLLYLDLVRKYSEEAGLLIHGYCLMTNHVHLIVTPREERSLAASLGRAHWRYSQELNRLHGRCGHLWQGRFYSCALDDAHAYRAMAYMERNPVRAKMTKKAWDYEWSTARYHVGIEENPAWFDMKLWERWTDFGNWKKELARSEDETIQDIRFHTRRGRPLGNDKFIAKMEAAIGHRIRPLPVGRPRKEENR